MSLDVDTRGSQALIDWESKEKVESTKLNLFNDWMPSIMQTKQSVVRDELDWKSYDAFMINRALSLHQDCLFIANEMNKMAHLPKEMQYDYLLGQVRSRKRNYVPWPKKVSDDNMKAVMRHFGYGRSKAIQALTILTEEQIEEIKALYKDI